LGLPTNVDSTSLFDNISANQFAYAITDAAGMVRALLTMLASESRARVLSSPQVLVIDNQEAKIQVGDQVPFRTSTSSTTTSTTSNIEFKDTGVILSVKPEIKAGGLIRMDISQEVITLGTAPEGINQPPLNRRSVQSNVAVESSKTIVLGGLISETSLDSSAGLPGLHNLPVVGGLFGSQSDNYQRRELVILITPTVIETSNEAVQVANELRERMRGIIPIESPWKQPVDEIGRQRRFFKPAQ
jgi:general secretion pathway protein D